MRLSGKETPYSGEDMSAAVAGLQEAVAPISRLEGELAKGRSAAATVLTECTARRDLALAKCADIPLCKTITDFCAHHGIASFLDCSPSQREELIARLTQLKSLIDAYTQTLLRAFGVENADLLSGNDRKEYDAAMSAFVAREDHYP